MMIIISNLKFYVVLFVRTCVTKIILCSLALANYHPRIIASFERLGTRLRELLLCLGKLRSVAQFERFFGGELDRSNIASRR